tara:strand:+ start:8886 stop:10052 length:1167 start_codon:yes stop_codon:yes gene_type:complete
MSINIDGNITDIYRGDSPIRKVYVGNDLVWHKSQPVVVVPEPPKFAELSPIKDWLHTLPESPLSNWPTQTNKGLVKIGNGPIKSFYSPGEQVGAVFDYGELVVPDAVGENAGNLVITFESRLLKDHDDNKRNIEIFLQSDSTISAFENDPITSGEVEVLPTGRNRYLSYGQKTSAQLNQRYVNRVIDNFPVRTNSIGTNGIVIANSSNMGDGWRGRRDNTPDRANFQVSFVINISDDWYDKNLTLYYRHAEGTATWSQSVTFKLVSYESQVTQIIQEAIDGGIRVTPDNLVIANNAAIERFNEAQIYGQTFNIDVGIGFEGGTRPVSGVNATVSRTTQGTNAEVGGAVATFSSGQGQVEQVTVQQAVYNPRINIASIVERFPDTLKFN